MRPHRTAPGLVLAACCVLVFASSARAQDKVMSAPFEERPGILEKLAPAEQVDEFVSASLRSDPPDLRLEDTIAKAGAAVVPRLKERLRDSDDYAESICVAGAFARMQELGTYDVKDDADLHRLFDETFRNLGNRVSMSMMRFQMHRIGWEPPVVPVQPTRPAKQAQPAPPPAN